jgi:NADH dehydrogenase/NADH:ubiquinone oxidoreductase subunit G
MLPITSFDLPLCETSCIECGQCVITCPVGALIERQDWHRVLEVLNDKKRKTIVQTAPATRGTRTFFTDKWCWFVLTLQIIIL